MSGSAPAYEVTIDGVTVDAHVDGLELDFVANGQDTFAFSIDLPNDGTRPTLDQEVVFLEDGAPIFRGPIAAAPEEGFGGPNLDRVRLEINAVGCYIWTTYRYVTLSVPAGTLKAALTAILSFLGSFNGVTLHPSQVDGPALPDLLFTQQRLDAVLQQLSDLSGGYLAEITPDNLYLWMFAPGTDSAPFDLLDSDTGEPKQVGDLQIEPTRDQTYANRLTLVVTGGGPATSAESFTAADGVSFLGFTYFNTKYPASDSATDVWPNLLTFDGVVQGPISFNTVDLVTNGGLFAWAWDHVYHRLVYDEGSGGLFPTGAQVIDVAYTIKYPFSITLEDVPSQAPPIGIRERIETITDGMTEDAASALATGLLAKRLQGIKKATFASWKRGWRIGQTMTITIAARDTNATFLITDVKMIREPNAGPEQDCFMRYEITALEGTTTQANWRDVPKSWGGSGRASSATSNARLVLASPAPPQQLANIGPSTVVGRASNGIGEAEGLAVGANLYTDPTYPPGPTLNAVSNVIAPFLDTESVDNRLVRLDGGTATEHGATVQHIHGSPIDVADDGSLTGIASLETSAHVIHTGRHAYSLSGATTLSFNAQDFAVDVVSAAFSPSLDGISNLSDGQFGVLINSSGTDVDIVHESALASPSASSRILCPNGSNLRFKNHSMVLFWRDAAASRVRVSGTVANIADANGYVEGTWTPVLKFGGATTGVTYSNQAGRYTRVGRLYHVQWNILLSSKGSATGAATLTGLPATLPAAPAHAAINVSYWDSFAAGVGGVQGYAQGGTSLINLRYPGAGAQNNLTDVEFTNTSGMIGECWFTV